MVVKNQLLNVSFCVVFSSDKYTPSGSIDFLSIVSKNKQVYTDFWKHLQICNLASNMITLGANTVSS